MKYKVKRESTDAATALKVELIRELCDKPIDLVAVLNYYYQIQNLNRGGGY